MLEEEEEEEEIPSRSLYQPTRLLKDEIHFGCKTALFHRIKFILITYFYVYIYRAILSYFMLTSSSAVLRKTWKWCSLPLFIALRWHLISLFYTSTFNFFATSYAIASLFRVLCGWKHFHRAVVYATGERFKHYIKKFTASSY